MSDLVDIVARIEEELAHAEANGHRLAPDCQGVAPGESVPAVRIDFIRAALGPAAAIWDEGHTDACDDHMCVEMGHLERNPYRRGVAR